MYVETRQGSMAVRACCACSWLRVRGSMSTQQRTGGRAGRAGVQVQQARAVRVPAIAHGHRHLGRAGRVGRKAVHACTAEAVRPV